MRFPMKTEIPVPRLSVIFGFALFLVSLVVAVATYQFVHFWLGTAQAGAAKMVFYEVKTGVSPRSISQELEKAGVITSSRYFYWYGRLTGKNAKFKAGDYRFSTKMRPNEVMGIIMSGISFGYPLTVPEGYSMYQIAELIENFRPGAGQHFLKLCKDRKFIAELGFNPAPATLEGYLFPDTYLVGRKVPETEIIKTMVRKYRAIFTPELANRARALGMSEHQVVTLASIVEKETGARQERPLIASVFHNRLKKKMKLQSDPTVIYGIENYNGNITRKDLDTYTPYNTYRIKALPPGPISNPGKDAILAALYPAESEYLYFVSHNNGTHEFTSTYDDHRKAVVQFQIDKRAREGRSWRELQKSQTVAPAASGQ